MKKAWLLALGLVLSGCVTNAVTGRSQLMLVSEESAISQSESAYNALIGDLSKSGKISSDQKLNSRIKTIAGRLIVEALRIRPEAKDWKWSIKVVDAPDTVNAFCMAGGKMVIYTGLIDKLKPSDDEIAQVMGHEISHALLGHQREKMSVQMAANATAAAVAAYEDPNNSRGVQSAASFAAMALIALPNSREQESEADRLGIELAARAGYSPHAAVTLWEKMIKVSGGSRFDLLSTHPASPKRMEALAALEGKMEPLYEAARASRPSEAESVPAFKTTPKSGHRLAVHKREARPVLKKTAGESVAGLYWCVAPSWSKGTIDLLPDGRYRMNGKGGGHYRVTQQEVHFDGQLQRWNNGVAKLEDGNLVFYWQNGDGSKQYFAYRKGS